MSILSNIFLFIISISITFGQYEKLKGYFLFPIAPGTQNSLAGTFGELRGNHFHSGIDIRTNGEVNKPVYATAEGYISRIKISENGFGKVLYIKHPNGFTTVYAHLNSFENKIEKYVRKAQYENKKFTIQLFPKPHDLPVNIGDLIALSGNTGGSHAPHLHFEVRNSKSEPINPLFAHFKELEDTIKPIISALTFAQLNSKKNISKTTSVNYIELDKQPQQKINKPFYLLGEVGLGIEVKDQNNGANNMNGINKILLYENEKLTYTYSIEKFAFSQSKYIKTHLEYGCYKSKKISAHRCYITPTNPLPFYNKNLPNKTEINSGETKNIRIEAYDFYKNMAVVEFKVNGKLLDNKSLKQLPSPSSNSTFIKGGIYQEFKTPDCKIYFSTNSLFESMNLELIRRADTFDLQMNTAPLKGKITIGLRPKTPHHLKEKTRVYSYNSVKKSYYNEGGNWNGDFIEFKTKSFAKYICISDTIKPVFKNPKRLQNAFKINITDNLSGISRYSATLNGIWVLVEHYPNDKLFQVLPNINQTLKGELIINVWDDVNNHEKFKQLLK